MGLRDKGHMWLGLGPTLLSWLCPGTLISEVHCLPAPLPHTLACKEPSGSALGF